ncbi:MAG TPA: YwqG family protein [Ktedonobacterales bacterium]
MDIDGIRAALRDVGLERVADEVERLTLPAIFIRPVAVEENAPSIGASKFGGIPDLPRDFEWPTWHGRALTFLAQFDLAEVAVHDVEHMLPSSGVLYVFYDFAEEPWGLEPTDRGGWRVAYWDGDKKLLAPIPYSPDVYQPALMPSRQLVFSQGLTLGDEVDIVHQYSLDEDEWELFVSICESTHPVQHQMIGNPLVIHYSGMPLMCESMTSGRGFDAFLDLTREPYEEWSESDKTLNKQASDTWRLLFQLGEIQHTPQCRIWADAGLMYFWIEKDRLAKRDFSNVWCLAATEF